ncbi:hypothetical protein FQA47_012674 [Oryzias melastigma]|uniref:Uncharacterized protein n=1 Tax=Oryzias melastigma TaxID=30732 RepID=A0A834F863_ORYME|nr:hypothetical protein FQA47_012674 [Oryzias melastigma]
MPLLQNRPGPTCQESPSVHGLNPPPPPAAPGDHVRRHETPDGERISWQEHSLKQKLPSEARASDRVKWVLCTSVWVLCTSVWVPCTSVWVPCTSLWAPCTSLWAPWDGAPPSSIPTTTVLLSFVRPESPSSPQEAPADGGGGLKDHRQSEGTRNVDILGCRKRTVHASCLLTANQLAVCFGEACLPVYATQTRPAKRPVKRLTRGCDSHPREPDFSGLEPATRTQVAGDESWEASAEGVMMEEEARPLLSSQHAADSRQASAGSLDIRAKRGFDGEIEMTLDLPHTVNC